MVDKPRKVRDSQRFTEILTTLTKNGFGFWINKLRGKKINLRSPDYPEPETVRETLEELGPTFVKFGQLLASRPDLVPERYVEELKKLQNQVPEFEGEKARRIVDEEVGLENFSEFNDEPKASASIAQVHEAKTKSGQEVIVKVRRPGIKDQMEADLDIMKYFAEKIDEHSSYKKGFIEEEINEFAAHTKDELNFMRELAKINEFRENTRDRDDVVIPRAFPDLSTERVLTLEKMDGVRIDEFEQLEAEINPAKLVSTGMRMIVRQVTSMGVLHGDPHPSNIWVNEEGQLIILDFGITARLSPREQKYFTEFMYYMGKKDIDKVVQTIERMSYVEEDADLDQFRRIAQREVLDIEYTPESYKTVSASMFNLFKEATKQGIYFPTKMLLIGKSMVTMEGIGLMMETDYDPRKDLEDAVRKELKHSLDPKETVEEFLFNASQNPEAITRLPNRVNQFEPAEKATSSTPTDNNQDKDSLPHPVLLIGLIGVSSFLMIEASEVNLTFVTGLLGFITGIYLVIDNLG